jgi:glucose/arabinose dehydrogenase
VEFPEDVVLTTRKQSDNSFGPLEVNIPSGTYNITLVSFDDHIEQPQEEDQTQESWFLQAENEKGDIVFESNAISDLPEAQNILEEHVEEHVEITQDITGLSARHVVDVGESETAESIGPVCAAFDRRVDNGVPVPTILDPTLRVRTVVSGLSQPTSMAFLGADDLLVLEKSTGRVQRVVNGIIHSTVLDLAVNFGSERGLLGIALHPNFPSNPGVYLYWTKSTTGEDTAVLANTPLLGNRVDRFVWDGSTLTFDKNLIQLRALQPSFAAEPTPAGGRGNHNGGVLRFGPGGGLFIFTGDVGRRGQLQNLSDGPFGSGQPDDQFGGPAPDNAHLTGVILRLNAHGSTPQDNPFFEAGTKIGGQVGANIRKIFSYGHRNSFGMAFDPMPIPPRSGRLWLQENGDDSFTELNRVGRGMNGGWVQIMGPVNRVAQFKEIETTFGSRNLQQTRWPPTNIANTPQEARSRLFILPEAHYSDPEFSWKFDVAPAGIGFMRGQGLGRQFEGDLFVGGARASLEGGYLFHFNLTSDRLKIAVDDPKLNDLVADNLDKSDLTESESFLIGRDFGTATDIQTGPNGNLFIVSFSNGAVYELFRRP